MTNRQEVAKKLREANKNNCGWFLTSDNAIYEVGKVIGAIGKPYDVFFNRLADLIDPTCEVIEMPDNDEFMVRIVSGFMCKKCRHETIVERNCDGGAEPPKYCPNCGARVVRDD